MIIFPLSKMFSSLRDFHEFEELILIVDMVLKIVLENNFRYDKFEVNF